MLQPPFSKGRIFLLIHCHQSHRLFSRLRNHSTVSLTIPLGYWYILVLISSNLVNHIPGCKQKRVAETTPLTFHVSHFHVLSTSTGFFCGNNLPSFSFVFTNRLAVTEFWTVGNFLKSRNSLKTMVLVIHQVMFPCWLWWGLLLQFLKAVFVF